jgi:hypothetical protein
MPACSVSVALTTSSIDNYCKKLKDELTLQTQEIVAYRLKDKFQCRKLANYLSKHEITVRA